MQFYFKPNLQSIQKQIKLIRTYFLTKMSIMMQNDEIIIISHENYINKVFESVNGSRFALNANLFDINEPFKSYEAHPRRKKRPQSIEIEDEGQSHPARLYKKYNSEVKKCLSGLTLAKTNQQSCTVSSIKFTESESITENHPMPDSHKGTTTNDRKRRLSEEANNAGKDEQHKPPNINALETVSRLQKLATCDLYNFNGSNTFPHAIKRTFNGVEYLFPANSNFISGDVAKCNPAEKFDVILMDPPWTNKAIRRKKRKRVAGRAHGAGYAFMDGDDIERLPIDAWLSEDGVVYVWCTNRAEHRRACARFFAKWRLRQVGQWHWLKVTKRGEPITPFTREELHMKQPYEAIVIGARGESAARWRAEACEKLVVSVPSAMHSHKPPLADVIRATSEATRHRSDVKCLELFARYLLPGWTSVGDEVLQFQDVCFYNRLD